VDNYSVDSLAEFSIKGDGVYPKVLDEILRLLSNLLAE